MSPRIRPVEKYRKLNLPETWLKLFKVYVSKIKHISISLITVSLLGLVALCVCFSGPICGSRFILKFCRVLISSQVLFPAVWSLPPPWCVSPASNCLHRPWLFEMCAHPIPWKLRSLKNNYLKEDPPWYLHIAGVIK